LLLIDEPTFTGCRVWGRPIGGLEMRDDQGFDFKVLCVAVGDPHYAHLESLEQVRPHRLVEIVHFFETYKLLEEKETEVLGWQPAKRALEVLLADRSAYLLETADRDGSGAPRTSAAPEVAPSGNRVDWPAG
jgi:inorganic pyrophosphatase